MPLRERVKEIFKKYGVTVTSIFLAVGATIAAVIGTITKALKELRTKLGKGLKALGAKAADALPGLIGAIDSGGGRISFSKVDEKELTRGNKEKGNHANNYRGFVNFMLWR